jgi:hypothetical protein
MNSTLVEFQVPTKGTKDKLILDASSGKGDELMLDVHQNSTYFKEQVRDNPQIPNVPVNITTATSITPSGKLWNITVDSDKETFYMDNSNGTYNGSYNNDMYPIAMSVNPIKGIEPGNYTLTVGAKYDTVNYSQIIDLVVLPNASTSYSFTPIRWLRNASLFSECVS